MFILSKLTKLLVIGIAAFFLIYCFNINPAYAEGNSLAQGTLILTPDDYVSIEELHSGDRVVGYNFYTHQEEVNVISEIQSKTSLSYYLINDKTRITGTHFVYVKTSNNPKIVKVTQLRYRDRLIGQNHSFSVVDKVKQIIKPSELYQIILENEEGNFFVDNFLVHGGDKIPTIFTEKSLCIDDQLNTPFYTECLEFNDKTSPGFLLAFALLIIGIISSKLLFNLYNFVRFYNKYFTADPELLEFTRNINPNFTNRYSTNYRTSSKVWKSIPLDEQVDESEYQHLITRSELIGKISDVFDRYQSDLANGETTKIVQYFPDFMETENYESYRKYFVNKNNISYQSKIIELGLIDFRQLSENSIFRVQINGEMINFTISDQGYVISEDSKIKAFSEYWDIEIDSDRQCLIKEISLPLPIRILQLDLDARRNTIADYNHA